MTPHAITMEIHPTSIALGLVLFLKYIPTLHSPDRASYLSACSALSPQVTAPWCQGHYREHALSPQKHTSYLECQLGLATDGLSSITPLSVL